MTVDDADKRVQKARFLNQCGSLWTCLQRVRQATGLSLPLTDAMLQRLQEEIDLAYTQCVVDVGQRSLCPSSTALNAVLGELYRVSSIIARISLVTCYS
jgi:hypothetical protein